MKKTVMFLAGLVIVLFSVSSFLGTVGAVVSGGEVDYCEATSDCISGECSFEGICVSLGADDCWGYGYGGGYGCDSDSKCVWGYGYGPGCGYGGYCGYDPECEEEQEEAAFCGDEVVDDGEECDDGNTIGGDGCSGECLNESFEVGLIMGHEYILETQKSRGFRPNPENITPFDNILCGLKVRESENPKDKIYTGELRWVDLSSSGEGLVKKTTTDSGFVFAKNEKGHDYYAWRIKGWPNGWGSPADIGKLVDGGAVKCVVNLEDREINSSVIELDTCVHIMGPDTAEYKFISMYGKRLNSAPNKIVKTGLKNTLAYMGTDPFAQYPKNFSHYADLKAHNDSVWETETDFINSDPRRPVKSFSLSANLAKGKSAPRQISIVSSCGNGGKVYHFYNSIADDLFSVRGMRIIFINPFKLKRWPISRVALHETGHNFCKLEDEHSFSVKSFLYWGEKNCVDDANALAPLGFKAGRQTTSGFGQITPKLYGDTNPGNNGVGCSFGAGFKTPSAKSVMNNHYEVNKFNVISCGYCLKEILNQTNYKSLGNNFEACMDKSWDTIKPGEFVCEVDVDCSTDGTTTCSRCVDNRCEFQGAKKECMRLDPSVPNAKWDFGLCELNEISEKASCKMNKDWECQDSMSPSWVEIVCPLRDGALKALFCMDHKCVYI